MNLRSIPEQPLASRTRFAAHRGWLFALPLLGAFLDAVLCLKQRCAAPWLLVFLCCGLLFPATAYSQTVCSVGEDTLDWGVDRIDAEINQVIP